MRDVAIQLDGGATPAGEKRSRFGQREECECVRQRRSGRCGKPLAGESVPLLRHSAHSGSEEQVPVASRSVTAHVVHQCGSEYRSVVVEQFAAHCEALPSREIPSRETRAATAEHRSAARVGEKNAKETAQSRTRHVCIRIRFERERRLVYRGAQVPQVQKAFIRTGEQLVRLRATRANTVHVVVGRPQ